MLAVLRSFSKAGVVGFQDTAILIEQVVYNDTEEVGQAQAKLISDQILYPVETNLCCRVIGHTN